MELPNGQWQSKNLLGGSWHDSAPPPIAVFEDEDGRTYRQRRDESWQVLSRDGRTWSKCKSPIEAEQTRKRRPADFSVDRLDTDRPRSNARTARPAKKTPREAPIDLDGFDVFAALAPPPREKKKKRQDNPTVDLDGFDLPQDPAQKEEARRLREIATARQRRETNRRTLADAPDARTEDGKTLTKQQHEDKLAHDKKRNELPRDKDGAAIMKQAKHGRIIVDGIPYLSKSQYYALRVSERKKSARE